MSLANSSYNSDNEVEEIVEEGELEDEGTGGTETPRQPQLNPQPTPALQGLDPNIQALLLQMQRQSDAHERREKETRKWCEAKLDRMEARISSQTKKRSRAEEEDAQEDEDEEPVLIDETVHLKDDAVNIVDLKLRNRLLQLNNDPAKIWTRANGAGDIRFVQPVRGSSLYLEHLMPGRVSALTLREFHCSSKRLYAKHFLTKNAGIEEDDDKRELSVTKKGKGAIAHIAPKFEEAESLWEVVDGVKNYVAATHMVRPYSYEVGIKLAGLK